MLLSLLYAVVRFLLEILLVRTSSEARLRAEVLALRHQLRILERQVNWPQWQPSDPDVHFSNLSNWATSSLALITKRSEISSEAALVLQRRLYGIRGAPATSAGVHSIRGRTVSSSCRTSATETTSPFFPPLELDRLQEGVR